MVETKNVPNRLQVSLVSPQTPEQVSLRCYIDLKGKRKAWTETRIRQAIEHRLPWRLSRRSPDIPDLVKHCVRSHTEYTRQYQSTDVKVWDNSPAHTLSFGKETADQAIQQGNARPLKPPRYRKGNHRAPSQQKHVLKCTAAMVSNTSKNSMQAINPDCLARNEAFDQHYKAIWLAGKSEGIEALKQDTDLNTPLNTSSRSQALQGPDILARFRDIDFRLLESRGISRKTSYLPRECRAAFREKVSGSTGIHGVVGIVGRNPRRINATGCKLDLKSPESMASQGIHSVSPVGHYNDGAEKYCWNQICPKWLANHASVTTNGLTGLVDTVSGVLARFRDIDFNGYRHCVKPNTPIEAIHNPARQHQSRDVKVGDNPRARMLSFGKEIEEHTIQQGSARVNNGMQQDIGELATQTSPLSQVNRVEPMYQQPESMPCNGAKPSYGNGELGTQFLQKGPRTRGIRGNNDSVGGNRGQLRKIPPKSREFGATAGIGGNTNSARTFRQETNTQ
ncbi:hypothetical protein R3P38DRAFT_2804948 [Favolaschia claudopus]|uniref:Uncharacterized protein n=1 Tax=Favolaschia claudopus TaxID=2862362 RepID=A0AAV9ZNS2_9AGAR